MTPRRVLVTGFDPFGGETLNAAWEAVRALDGFELDAADGGTDRGAVVHARRLPCVFGAALERLGQSIDDVEPELVVCVGQAAGRSEISLERVAINLDDGRIADNAGRQPIDTKVVDGGPAAYFSSLPIKAIVRDLRRAGIPASVSNTAGTFVCNHAFYGLMHRLATASPAFDDGRVARGGFIHVPILPAQSAALGDVPSMALETLVAGLRIALRTALTVEHDIVATGGRLD